MLAFKFDLWMHGVFVCWVEMTRREKLLDC